MNNRREMNPATSAGFLLVLVGILSAIVWGFGPDRFLWIAGGSAGVGLLLLVLGVTLGRDK